MIILEHCSTKLHLVNTLKMEYIKMSLSVKRRRIYFYSSYVSDTVSADKMTLISMA